MRVNLPNLYNTWRLRKSQHTNCMSKFIENSIAVHFYIKKPCTFQIFVNLKYLIILRMLTKECFSSFRVPLHLSFSGIQDTFACKINFFKPKLR